MTLFLFLRTRDTLLFTRLVNTIWESLTCYICLLGSVVSIYLGEICLPYFKCVLRVVALLTCITFAQPCNFVILPKTANKLFPKNGNPGRLANTIIRKSGCITITDCSEVRFVFDGTIRLPSDNIISPDSIKVYKKFCHRYFTPKFVPNFTNIGL